MAAQNIERLVTEYGQLLLDAGLPIHCVALYGSHVSGEVNPDSDIDVAVVLTELKPTEARSTLLDLWAKTLDVDTRIEPILCDLAEWTGSDCRPIIAAARLEGVEIFHAETPSLARN